MFILIALHPCEGQMKVESKSARESIINSSKDSGSLSTNAKDNFIKAILTRVPPIQRLCPWNLQTDYVLGTYGSLSCAARDWFPVWLLPSRLNRLTPRNSIESWVRFQSWADRKMKRKSARATIVNCCIAWFMLSSTKNDEGLLPCLITF